jgi:hypothetical protein
LKIKHHEKKSVILVVNSIFKVVFWMISATTWQKGVSKCQISVKSAKSYFKLFKVAKKIIK